MISALLNRQIFKDPPVTLTDKQEWDARYDARRAAREARGSARTAHGQYRRYRKKVDGALYLDWPRWKAEYDKVYRGGGTGSQPTSLPPTFY
ncbi:hypothetical protein [Tsukamurella tyrosinosolvens]|uniref:hypothetical protein n=1 Tax=Tsukamurella tyrosinosolvens TaxID=57704 RepID=UPI00125F5986|nr:hypothetical protein [Tsukamurella tyrosinosolvens]